MFGRSLVLFVCFGVASGVVARTERPEPAPVRQSFDTFPMQLGEWRGVQQPPLDPSSLAILRVDDYLSRAYFTEDHSAAGLYIGYYGSQRQGDTMHSPLNCLPGSGWEPVSRTMIPVSLAGDATGSGGSEVVINRYIVQKGPDRQLVLYWYQSHGRVVASEYWGKFYLIRDAVRLNRTDGALVRVIVPIVGEGGEAHAEQTGIRFVKVLFPALAGYLPT
jgi:EpsI family protein